MFLSESFILRNEKIKRVKLFLNKIVALKKDVFLIYFLIKFPENFVKDDDETFSYECDPDLIQELASNLSEDLGIQVSSFSRSATYEKNNLIFAAKGVLDSVCLSKLSKLKPINFIVKETKVRHYDHFSRFKEKKTNAKRIKKNKR